MLLLGNNIEKFLINSLILSTGIVALNPGVIPVWFNGLAANNNPAVFHGEQCAVASEANL